MKGRDSRFATQCVRRQALQLQFISLFISWYAGSPFVSRVFLACVWVQASGTTTFMSDLGDNLAAGAPGDRANLLSAVLRVLDEGPPPAGPSDRTRATLFAAIMDPRTVQRCVEAGAGAKVSSPSIGTIDRDILLRKDGRDGRDGGPAAFLGIPSVTVARIVHNWQGPCAVVTAERRGHTVTLVLTAKKWAFFNPQDIVSLGLVLADYRIVVLKLGMVAAAMMDAAPAPAQNLLAESVGPSSVDIDYTVRPGVVRPIWPLDRDFDYTPR